MLPGHGCCVHIVGWQNAQKRNDIDLSWGILRGARLATGLSLCQPRKVFLSSLRFPPILIPYVFFGSLSLALSCSLLLCVGWCVHAVCFVSSSMTSHGIALSTPRKS